ncbi:MAG: putative sugar transferase EpsL [bacterium ADurb.Bin363]|nr:MAG: putative sugar transferase EpsL [bacterium ADurb.Bin363]
MTLLQKIVKRIFDIFISIIAILTFCPVSLVIAILIKLESQGPVFFTQTRVGKDGRDFIIYKFRTMVEGAEHLGAGLEIEKKDPRITVIGALLRRTSLDEFPQFINILKGEMSFIGPRPTVPSQVDKYTPRQKRRLEIKPGLTGLAQVSGRNTLSWAERIELDIEYIDNYSLLLDMKIFLKTFGVVLFSKDVYGKNGNKGI